MNPVAVGVFLALVGTTLAITWWAGRRTTSVGDHLVAGGSISGVQNGLAVAGDYISAVSFLGVTGAIALTGFNGFYLAVFVPAAYVLALLLVAQPLRSLGRFTLADVLATRFPGRPVRGVMAASTVVISIAYLVSQFVGGALLVRLLFGLDYRTAVLVIGGLATVYTLVGGMLATTWIQIVKTCILLATAAVVFGLVLVRLGAGPWSILAQVRDTLGTAMVTPQRGSFLQNLDQFSLVLGITLGVLGLPHVMVRFLTVRDARAARSSALTAICVFSGFFLVLPFIAYGAALIVGRERIVAASPAGNLAMPQLAEAIGGDVLLAVASAVAFATIMAVLSGLVLATTGALTHDLYSTLLRGGRTSGREQLRFARIATLATCVVTTVLTLGAAQHNVAVLASMAITVAASANLPALLLTIYWRRTTSTGILSGMTTGLVVAIGIMGLGPTVLGDDALVGLSYPAVVSVPLAFLAAVAGSVLTAPRDDLADEHAERFARVRRAVRGERVTA
jgi:SSS family transporter